MAASTVECQAVAGERDLDTVEVTLSRFRGPQKSKWRHFRVGCHPAGIGRYRVWIRPNAMV